MQERYPIPDYVLDAYTKCTVKANAKVIQFPRRQFKDAVGNDIRVQQWFDLISKETGLDVKPSDIFQICILNHLTVYEPATCPTCGKILSLYSHKRGVKFCCNRCAQLDPAIQNKIKSTMKAHYGVESALRSPEILAKMKQTNLAKYGVEHVTQANCIKEKSKQTCLKKYGVENPYQAETIKKKIKQTLINHYGVDSPIKNEKIHNKIKQTLVDRYGVDHQSKSKDVREKTKQTNLERYGSTAPAGNKDIQEKIRKTFLKNYGVDHPLRSKIVQDKLQQTNLEKYGVSNPLLAKEIRARLLSTRQKNNWPIFKEFLASKKISILSTEDDFVNKKELMFKCQLCSHEWQEHKMLGSSRRMVCPNCTRTNKGSIEEKMLLHYIQSIYSGPIIENTRKVISPYELDVYLPDLKLAFEFNGTYWHSENAGKPSDYHITKTRLCNKQGIRLIHIFEYEWVFNQEKIKSLIKSALGIFDVKLYARRCQVKLIDAKDYRDFLLLNHLQSAVGSPIRYGLYYQNELVSVIGFGQSRYKKGETELHRYCVKAGYQIVGGFSKLIKYACKDANITEFYSYIDLAHFSGRGYKKIGFEKVSVTSPSYIYIRGEEIKSRLQCQKHKLHAFLDYFDPQLSETENMLVNDYDKVYDCGNLKVVYKV